MTEVAELSVLYYSRWAGSQAAASAIACHTAVHIATCSAVEFRALAVRGECHIHKLCCPARWVTALTVAADSAGLVVV